jgi:hypothetical protein
MNSGLHRELLALRDIDFQRREELVREGTLFDGYHPRMEAVHLQNAARLKEIIRENGWPSGKLVGEDGAEAAWLIVMHAISDPAFQREMLAVLKAAAAQGEAPAYQPAYLEDRICMYEGRPQIYGTQFTVDDEGRPAMWTISDPEHVNERRAAIGLDTIEHRTEQMLRETSLDARPKDMSAYRQGYEDWLRRVGWRD